MKEDQVVSLELARKLKLLNVKQDSIFWWVKYAENTHPIVDDKNRMSLVYASTGFEVILEHKPRAIYSAFTATEILNRLPARVKINTAFTIKDWEEWELYITHFNNKWSVAYVCDIGRIEHAPIVQEESDESLSNASAKMLIYLLENKLINTKDSGMEVSEV